MTEQLYYKDPHVLDFTATVQSAEATGSGLEVRLNRTAFYPEGGGQPSDLGTIDDVPVLHVRKQDGEIIHVLDITSQDGADAGAVAGAEVTTEVGTVVRGVVDGARRRDYMQQHTGQHIISAALMTVGNYNTVSVHLGEEYSTIEIDAPSIPQQDLLAVEDAANASIERAAPVSATVVNDDGLGAFSLRRPPKVHGAIRIVTVEDVDCVACGGVHVENTRHVRLVRLIGTESIRGRVRLYWKIGDRAINDYRMTSAVVRELGETLSAQPQELIDRIRRQEERIRDAESALKRERERVCRFAAERLVADAEHTGQRQVVTAEFDGEDKDFLRGVAKVLSEKDVVAACLTNRSGEQLQWCIVLGSGAGLEFNALRDELLPVVDGKGGGRPPVWQGVGTRPDAASEFLTVFRRITTGD